MGVLFLLLLFPILAGQVQGRYTALDFAARPDASQSDEETSKAIRCGPILVRGSEELTETEVCQLLQRVSNGQLDPESRKLVEAEVLKKYYQRGFLEAALKWNEPEKSGDTSAPVVIVEVQEGPVYRLRRLEMIGNENTSDRVIRRRVALQEGAAFDEELLELSVRRINQLGIFEEFTRADVEVRVSKKGHFVDLAFRLREKP